MEKINFPLSKLTVAEKLQLMEAIWDDLSRQDLAFDSPHWHEEVLKDREQALATGKATISDWEEAKERIKRNVL
ncbi:MAG: addiction module protein [Desulfosoma sp.]